jgi:phenylacetate-CoA ligase
VTDKYYDQLEIRDPAQRELAQFNLLPDLVRDAMAKAPGWTEHLKGVDPASVISRAALAKLPVLRKSALKDLQAKNPPYGGFTTSPAGALARIFMSPGPIFEIDTDEPDYFRGARAMFAGGFRPGDVVYNTFSYHLTPAGIMMESALRALGCAVVPGGVGNTELQLDAIAAIKPTGYVGTPSFLKIIFDKADELGVKLPTLKKALVSGEAFPASLREALSARGIAGYQAYASADAGSIAYESEARQGLVVDEGVLIEIVRPGTGDPVLPGEVGEVVVTSLVTTAYPLIRFGTGDLSALLPESVSTASPCGRSNIRLRGWLGRADQTTKVKGMFVHPSQVAEIVRRHPEIARARLIVDQFEGADRMTLHVEARGVRAPPAEPIVASIREVTKLRGEVAFHAEGELANDGKVIDDLRKYT